MANTAYFSLNLFIRDQNKNINDVANYGNGAIRRVLEINFNYYQKI